MLAMTHRTECNNYCKEIREPISEKKKNKKALADEIILKNAIQKINSTNSPRMDNRLPERTNQ